MNGRKKCRLEACAPTHSPPLRIFLSRNGAGFKLRSVLHFPAARLRSLPLSFFLSGAVVVLSLALPLPTNGTIAGLPSVCPFFNATGLPCPGCGLTRSFVCLGHGHLRESFAWHPLGPLLFSGALLYLVGTVLRWKWPDEKRALIALAGVLLLCWGLRLGGVFPLPT